MARYLLLLTALLPLLGLAAVKGPLVSHTPAPYLLYAGISTTTGLSHQVGKSNFLGITVTDKPHAGFNTGFRLGYNALSWISVETGIEYSFKGRRQNLDDLTFGWNWNGNGFTPDDSYVKTTYHHHYIDVPLGLNFTLGTGKLKGIISTGMYFNFLIATTTKSKGRIEGEDFSSNQTTETNKAVFNLSPFFGAGIEYALLPQLNLRALPLFQIQALENENAQLPLRLYNVGLNLALNYSFLQPKAKK